MLVKGSKFDIRFLALCESINYRDNEVGNE